MDDLAPADARAGSERAFADSIEVSFQQPGRVFSPQQIVPLTVNIAWRTAMEWREATGKSPAPHLEWRLVPMGSGKSVASGELQLRPTGNGKPIAVPLAVTLPSEEGVYTLHLTAMARKVPKMERAVQLVVVDATHRAIQAAPATSQLVDSFDPGATGLFRKIVLDGSLKKHDAARGLVPKPPRQEADPRQAAIHDVNAIAYRLKVSHPGRPHLVEIRCAARSEQPASLCLVERDSQGQFVPLGPGVSFVAAPPSNRNSRRAGRDDDFCAHRQIFWPNDREPALVLVGRQPGSSPDISRIQLYELGERLPPQQFELAESHGDHRSQAWRPRLVGPCLNQLDLPRNFCGPRSTDSNRSVSADDWQTYLLSARRLTEYLMYRGQNALILSVPDDLLTTISQQAREGSDTDSFVSDPSSIDILELVLRYFDREGLVLIPELQFDALLESSFSISDESDDVRLIECVDRPSSAKELVGEQSVNRFNPLSDRVQQVILGVVAQFLERYSGHASFGGLAFRLSPNSCLQFPGIAWGYDDSSVRRFEETMQVRIPRLDGDDAPAAVFHFLTTTARREWVRFRTAEVAAFHRRLLELVVEARPDAGVILTGQMLLPDDADPTLALIGMVRAGASPARGLAEQGLDFSLLPYGTDARVTVMRPIKRLETRDARSQAAAESLNQSPTIDSLFRGASPGCLVQPLGPLMHLPLFPFCDGKRQKISVVSSDSRITDDRSFAQLLASLDAQAFFEGAGTIALLPAGEEQPASRVICRLPHLPFRPTGPQIQPVVVRSAQSENRTWIYAVNASSLPVTVELLFDCSVATPVHSLADGSRPGLVAASAKKARARIELAGHNVWAVQFEHPGVAVSETHVSLSDYVLTELTQRIGLLNANMKLAARSVAKPGRDAGSSGVSHTTRHAGWEAQAGYDDSIDGDDVRQLTKTVSSVKLAWEEGRYADCQRMLEGYWGQMLLSMPAESPPKSSPRPKLTDRLRDKLKR